MSMFYEEEGYINALKEIVNTGSVKNGRNGATISKFGFSYVFDMEQHGFPLFTTKKMFFKGIVSELLWFLKGETNSKILENENVNIWKGNSSREFLDSVGLFKNEEGDCGPIYGWQWRYFNKPYNNSNLALNHESEGIDQIKYVIDEIKKESRRAVLSAWNPQQLGEMALPPCHILYIFDRDGEYLNCHMTMRSSDMYLGLPFNVASCALLLKIMAICTSLTPKKILISTCNAHVYEEHIENVKEQITRTPKPFPSIDIQNKSNILTTEMALEFIQNLKIDDFKLSNYEHHDKLGGKMVA
jgi:thymidylate synthase